ncbi:MAG: hypothetical protein ACKVJK_16405, partial [Methylophagaceae bacterium]
ITLGGSGLTRTIAKEEISGSETSTVVTVSGSEDGVVFQDSVSIIRVDTGTDGLTILNTNQAHMFPADATGSILDFSNSGTHLSIFEGATLLEYNPLNPTSPYQGHWKLTTTVVTPSGKLSVGAITDGGKHAVVAEHTAMDRDTEVVNVSYPYIGRKLNGELFSGSFQQSITKGRAGKDAIQITNSNSSHTFPALADGSVSSFTGGGTTLEVYEGGDILTFTTGTVTNGEFSISVEDVGGLTEGTVSGNGTTSATISAPSAMSVDSVVLTYTISGKRLGGEAFTRTTTQSFSKAKEGVVGTNAKTVTLTSASPIFRKNRAGVLSPTSIVITANGQNLTQAGAFSTSAGTLTSKTESSSGGVATVTSANFVDGMVVTYTAHSNDGSIADTVTLAQLDEGSGNVTALLSNEAHIVPANNDGSVDSTSYGGSGTVISVFEGATALDYDGSGTTAGHWTVAATQSPASTITIGDGDPISDSTNFAVVPQHGGMVDGTDSVTISYAISGKTANGTTFTPFTKTQTITKSKAGEEGKGSQFAYLLNNSASTPSTPTAIETDSWAATPGTPTSSNKYVWVSQRTSTNGTFGNFSTPGLFANFAEDGAPGAAGSDSKSIKLTASQYAVLYNGAGTKTTVEITLTGTHQNFSSPQYRFLENGVERQTWSTTSTYTIPDSQEADANVTDLWRVEVREGASGTYDAFDEVNIYGLKQGTDGDAGDPGAAGADSYTVILTNESHTLPTTNTGTVTYTGSGTS